MDSAVCTLSVIPVRKENSETSEMTSQLLFGELFHILERKDKWFRIRMNHDQYEGWISSNQATEISEAESIRLNSSKAQHSYDLVQLISNKTNDSLQALCLGSTIYNEDDAFNFYLNKDVYLYDGTIIKPNPDQLTEQLIQTAKMYLNSPYLWGGRTPFGIDCSGFTQIVFKLSGIELARDSSQQAKQGETLNFLSDASPGDLAFFDNEEGTITHVGIILDDQKIIHASGKVRIDDIDHQGIYNREQNAYSHQLRLIKKMI